MNITESTIILGEAIFLKIDPEHVVYREARTGNIIYIPMQVIELLEKLRAEQIRD